MGVGGEGEAVAGIVVAADCVLVNVGGLDDGGGLIRNAGHRISHPPGRRCKPVQNPPGLVGLFSVEAVAGEGAGEVIAAEYVALEAVVAAFFLTGFEFGGIGTQYGDGFCFGSRQAEPGAEHHLFGGGEIDADKGALGFSAEVGILQTGEERGIEETETAGELGFRGLPINGEALPDLVLFTTEGVERHRDVGRVALPILNEFPVVAETGNEADVVFYPAVWDITGLDQVNDREQH